MINLGVDMSFFSRYKDLAQTRAPLCIGIDPTPQALANWGLPDTASGAEAFVSKLVSAVGEMACVFKPQAAYFERFGIDGIALIQGTLDEVRRAGALSILDAKRGDIGSTSKAYAQGYLSAQAPFSPDALTVTPYLGFEALDDFYTEAAAAGRAVFVVARSSNPEGGLIQTARMSNGKTVAEHIIQSVEAKNLAFGEEKSCLGAVVGATLGEEAGRLAAMMPTGLILAPGIGAQGASIADLAEIFGDSVKRVIPSASRSIYSGGSSKAALQDEASTLREQLLQVHRHVSEN